MSKKQVAYRKALQLLTEEKQESNVTQIVNSFQESFIVPSISNDNSKSYSSVLSKGLNDRDIEEVNKKNTKKKNKKRQEKRLLEQLWNMKRIKKVMKFTMKSYQENEIKK